jgi:N-acetylmuramoyl-L-alanine amidase
MSINTAEKNTGILNLFHYWEKMVGRPKILHLCLFFLLISFGTSKANHLEVKLKPGDGIYSLLHRYNLYQHKCNRDAFYQLNNLKSTDYLKVSKKYKLPILLFEFNQISIRKTVDIPDFKRALRIQHYNDSLYRKGIKDADFRKDKNLWVPYHEYDCNLGGSSSSAKTSQSQNTSAQETSTADNSFKPYKMKVPILGKGHNEITVQDESLSGCVYYLVSGHGGPDPGAMTHKGIHSLCEDEYAYDVTLRLARQLLQRGAIVYVIIRDYNDGIRDVKYLGYDKDEMCWGKQKIPRNQVARLRQRTSTINRLYEKNKKRAKLQRVIAIHVDSRSEGQKIDVFFYHYPGSKKGKALADTMLNTFRSKYAEFQKDRGYRGVVKSRNLWMLRESKPNTLYIELGNITNDYDQKRILNPDNREALSKWIYLGLNKEAKLILKR